MRNRIDSLTRRKTVFLAVPILLFPFAAQAQEMPRPNAGAANVATKPVTGASEMTVKLIAAIRDGDAARVSALIAKGAEVNATDANGSTPLMQAAAAAPPEIVRLLLNKGANLGAKDKSGFSPLLVAAYSGHVATVQLLLDKGADPQDADNDGRTALMGAAYSGKEGAVKLLLDKNASVRAADKDGFTALMVASGTRNVPLVQLLIGRGGDVNAATRSGFTPLMQASGAGRAEVVSLLLEKGASVNARAGKGASALLVAAYAGNADIAKLLIDRGAEVNVADAIGHTPLIGAAYSGSVAVARMALERGADRDAQTKAGLDALMQAAYSGRTEVARLLLERGAAVDSRTARGLTPLMQAVGAGNEAAARILLIYGADVNAADASNQTPAIWAKKRGHEELIPFLQKMGAMIDGVPGEPAAVPLPANSPVAALGIALPPMPGKPEITGARRVGTLPGRPFLYRIPASGKAPLTFSAENLPPGLFLDAKSGLITGVVAAAGTYPISLRATNAVGTAARALTLICGPQQIGLTPPMGWSAWNLYGDSVDAAKIKMQADWMVKSGLAAHGYSYILLDDSWQGRRDLTTGEMTANARLGSIKALGDYLHARGLKLGIYSAPNAETSGGYAGSEGHETQDAQTFAAWGVDYLKYDWADNAKGRNNVSSETVTAAFAKMRDALDATNRAIFYALTPYDFGGRQAWANPPVRANSWWKNVQVLESWEFISRNVTNLSSRYIQPASVGHWNDPGWLLIGKIGSASRNPHFTKLTPDEQKTQMSAWCLAAAPLILSCDLTQLDPNRAFPISAALLTNDEVLSVDQDALGLPADRIVSARSGSRRGDGRSEIWARPLADGTIVVGLFNKSDAPQIISVSFDDLPKTATGASLTGSQPVRDLWLRKEMGNVAGMYETMVPRHGAALIKIGASKTP